jgi:hypothetical protein
MTIDKPDINHGAVTAFLILALGGEKRALICFMSVQQALYAL